MPHHPKAHIAALALNLHIPAVQSLKEKRRVIKSVKDRIHAQFNASVSETGDHDKWQSAILGACVIGGDKNYISGTLESILALVEGVHDIQITNHQIEFL